MSKIVVEIMPKPELLDPQGKAVGGVLRRLELDGITEVRIGKRFEVTTDGPVTDEVLNRVRSAADDIFSNPIIENVVSISVEDA